MLERNGHGGDLTTAQELYGVPARRMLDFSANINPLGPPPGLRDVLAREWESLTHYPDPESRELRRAIAAKYEVNAASILTGNGAAELIDLIARTLKPTKAAVIEPAFREYAEAAIKAGAEIMAVPTYAEHEFAVPEEELLDACREADLLFIGQPNNPTGHWLSRDTLLRLMETAASHNTVIVADEAFLDFFEQERELTLIREAAESRHLIVTRSMTKFYAIPGLRLGYAVAHPDMVKTLKEMQVPWSVNHLAQAAGVFSLAQTEYERQTRQIIAQERLWLEQELRSMGCFPYPGQANFILVRLGETAPNAAVVQRMLGAQGILVRRCAGFKGLDDRFFRIAVRTRPENERLAAALRNTLECGQGA
ncbi:threonine-phosphate decarboxylase [Paenibacillus sp. HN-1]|uniref:threonine-phosphate decarboxylase CobD n=1 Tax=Paenibacillus TaxID=44249 RepID=UPI001CA829A8|nr:MULTISPECIES: threonine-phosphate decarboxylase CobD [Paenibacillus]MBY9078153.1 threonine-phosphate decarboxylase [Paenibacillus sp. CGMCC 1.18879]MBY9083894.1 threonine-phosphate decarboxylase [Paenibacillus sinensis]